MNSTFLIFLGTLCTLGLAYQVNENESPPPKLPLRPGDLLRSLDAITSDAQVIYSPLQKSSQQLADRRAYHDDDGDSESESIRDNQESASDYDYDKAYENFVNKYFAKGEEELDPTDEEDQDDEFESEKSVDTDYAEPFEFSNEDDEKKTKREGKQSSKSKNCERVKIDNQNCKICEDPVSNEKSKTCSYSSENKPKSYAFSKERSTKHSDDNDDDDSDEENDDSKKSAKSFKRDTSSSNKKKAYQPRRTSIESILKTSSPNDNFSRCTRKLEDGMVCFYCGPETEKTRECMVNKNNVKKHRLDESSKTDSEKKRIFKRMVTYSFKNDADPKFKERSYSVFKGY